MITYQIGSGHPLFALPGGRFINATQPLPLITRPLTELEAMRFIKTGVKPKELERSA